MLRETKVCQLFKRSFAGALAGFTTGLVAIGGPSELNRGNQLVNFPLYIVLRTTAAGFSAGFLFSVIDSAIHCCQHPDSYQYPGSYRFS